VVVFLSLVSGVDGVGLGLGSYFVGYPWLFGDIGEGFIGEY
jgi:hypothetical protein